MNEIFNELSEKLSLVFAEKTVEELPFWIEDEVGKRAFLALVSKNESKGSTRHIESNNYSFVCSVEMEYDPTETERLEAEELAKSKTLAFVHSLEEYPRISVGSWDITERFRSGSDLRTGYGLEINISSISSLNYARIIVK